MGKPDQPRGPDGRWIPRRGGALIAAIALALGLASGTGLTSASGVSGGTSGTFRPPDTAKSQKARDRNPDRLLTRLARQGLRVEQRFTSDDGDCEAHSYGLVREFFRDCPCAALFRALFEVRDERGNVVLVAVAWVDMPDVRRAREFKELVDRDGTGNITELSRETAAVPERALHRQPLRVDSRRDDGDQCTGGTRAAPAGSNRSGGASSERCSHRMRAAYRNRRADPGASWQSVRHIAIAGLPCATWPCCRDCSTGSCDPSSPWSDGSPIWNWLTIITGSADQYRDDSPASRSHRRRAWSMRASDLFETAPAQVTPVPTWS